MERTLLFSLMGLAVAFGAIGGEKEDKTSSWIAKQRLSMEAFSPSNLPANTQTNLLTDPDVSGLPAQYPITGNVSRAFFRFSSSQWVYIVTHSTHLRDGVGDVILARDQGNQHYQNDAHVCGGVVFVTWSRQKHVQNSLPRGS